MKRLTILLSFMIIAINLLAQSNLRTISGTVTDESGVPIPGVNVLEKGTTNGTITDFKGTYKLRITNQDPVLIFSFIGMITEEVPIKSQTIVNIILKADPVALDECVVVAYGRKYKKNMGGIRIRGNKAMTGSVSYMPMAAEGYYPQNTFNTEGYSSINENGYKVVTDQPLSTFSVDVDRAAYANIRRFINNGQLPPKDAVRIEEMINYFQYDYDGPKGDDPFAIDSELARCPWNKNHILLKVGLQGKKMEKENLPPSNLVFLIDVSGSMNSSNKLPLLKSAFSLLVDELRPQDHVSIVVYAGAAGLVLEPTAGNEKQKLLQAINQLNAGGSTAGGAGLKLAYKTAQEQFIENGNNRIVLATDGDFNVGETSNASMERLVESNRDKGIFITVLGFGMGNYKDDKMEIIADKGNGNYAYIDNLQEARKTLVSEFGGTLFTIAKDVKFQIEFNPNRVLAYRLIGYENRLLNAEDFNDDKKDAGEIGAGHTVTALYEIIPKGASDADVWIKPVDELKYQTKTSSTHQSNNEWLTLKLRYKQPDGNKSKLLTVTLNKAPKNFEKATDNFKFAASVAGFGMLLQQSEFMTSLSYENIANMAKKARGNDGSGFKAEMVRLIETAETLSKTSAMNNN